MKKFILILLLLITLSGCDNNVTNEELDILLEELFYEVDTDYITHLQSQISELEFTIYELENPYSMVSNDDVTMLCDNNKCQIKFYDDNSKYYISLDIRQLDNNTVYIDVDRTDKETHLVSKTTNIQLDTISEDYIMYSTYYYFSIVEHDICYDDIYNLYLNK